MTGMKNIIKTATVGFLALSLAGCIISMNDHRESKNRISEDRQLAPFTKIMVDSRLRLDVVVGQEQSISVMGVDRSVYATKTSVKNGVLTLSVNTSKHGRPRVRVSVPTLDSLDFDARVDARVKGLDVENFYVKIDGSGSLFLSGSCGTSSLEVDGNADVYADRLKCNEVSVEVDGNGEVSIYAKDKVIVDIEGRADLTVYGGGRVETSHISDGGSIRVR